MADTPTTRPDKPVILIDATAETYIHAATSENTRRTYRSAIKQFERWGGRLPCQSDTIIRYILDKAGHLNPRTLDLQLTAVSQWHRYQGFDDPIRHITVKKTMEGVRRIHVSPKKKAKALRLEHLIKMTEYLNQQPNSHKKYRDLALILMAFFGAFRRSELVMIKLENLQWEPEGLTVAITQSKTDQYGIGILRALPYGDTRVCAAKAVRAWIEHSGIESGYLFRPINRWGVIQDKGINASAINTILKQTAHKSGIEQAADFSSHSFRRGLSTSAAREGIDFELIKKQGGWRSDATVREYIDEGQLFDRNASSLLMKRAVDLFKQQ